MFNEIISFYIKSHPVTLVVLAVLASYFFAVNWIFFYRFLTLKKWTMDENDSLESILMGATHVSDRSFLRHFIKSSSTITKELFDLALFAATKEATKGLSFLSIVASTSPFIGLFGTVVSILDTFSHIGQSSGTMAIIASGVSDALVATATGIFVAIFAYTYHQLLKRKSFELTGLLKMQSDSILSRSA